MEELQSWPTLMTERGLFKKPHALIAWDEILAQQPEPAFATFFHEPLSFFTDGSTANGNILPRSAWSLVLSEDLNGTSVLVESAPLAGKQSNFRAELTGAWVAIQHGSGGTIHSDNQAVITGLRRLIRFGWQSLYWIKQRHCHLWYKVWLSLLPKRHLPWLFEHVKAHRCISQATSKHEQWEIILNDRADSAAKQANTQWDADALQCYCNALRQQRRLCHQAKLVFQLQERVFTKCSSMSTTGKTQMGMVSCSVVPPSPLWEQARSIQLPLDPDLSIALLCPPFLAMLIQFFRENTWAPCDTPCSIAELYLGFIHTTGWLVPMNVGLWSPNQIAEQKENFGFFGLAT